MLNWILQKFVACCLSLRYRLAIQGLADVAARGRKGILFLPNHPALIDPIIMMSILMPKFAVRALADKDQVDRFFVRWLAKNARVLPIPDVGKYGPAAKPQIEQVMQQCIKLLAAGENVMLYPSGHIYQTRYEDLRGNFGVELILNALPDVRVVLVRQSGLWGSVFSKAAGHMPTVGQVVPKMLLRLLANGLIFSPRRKVNVEFFEPADLPRRADRTTINAYLEKFYNKAAPPNTYVPYTIWEGGGTKTLPEPVAGGIAGDPSQIPQSTRKIVVEYLSGICGRSDLNDSEKLSQDLGIDSLAKAELLIWLDREFGCGQGDIESLNTVGDVLLAAAGGAVAGRCPELKFVPRRWLTGLGDKERISAPQAETIADAFLQQAARTPGKVVVADQLRGEMTYRDLITAVMVLKPLFEKLPGQRIGIMLPASTTATTIYLALLFAGKTPVMVNWTVGIRAMTMCLEMTQTACVLTAGAMLAKLKAQGMDVAPLDGKITLIEKLAGGVSLWTKIRAAAAARFNWSALRSAKISQTAAILFTSGSEATPKAVPLTGENILTNVRDVLSAVFISAGDRMMAILPPFHSFGLTVNMVLPLTAGLPAVYHPNPTESPAIARIVQAFKATLLIGTPTFLRNIVRAASPGQMDSLRLAVVGAEKCPPTVYELIARQCPKTIILEGYGITECSPIVSVNDPNAPQHGSIGKHLASFQCAIIDEATGQELHAGETGMLLVRGPCVFGGYIGQAADPFVEHGGKKWYRTGDLVCRDENGVMTFVGRLKRFIKLGGEMISLPAIESVIATRYASDDDEGPVVAVEATPSEDQPEIVLFTTLDSIDRVAINKMLQDAGLSPLHNIRRVEKVAAIPTLGTGKTDYKELRRMLA